MEELKGWWSNRACSKWPLRIQMHCIASVMTANKFYTHNLHTVSFTYIYIHISYSTYNGNHKGLPAFRIMSKTVTDGFILNQAANSWYQWRKKKLIGLADISLENEENRCVHLPRNTHINISIHTQCMLFSIKLCMYITYQYCCKWHNDRVCDHVP